MAVFKLILVSIIFLGNLNQIGNCIIPYWSNKIPLKNITSKNGLIEYLENKIDADPIRHLLYEYGYIVKNRLITADKNNTISSFRRPYAKNILPQAKHIDLILRPSNVNLPQENSKSKTIPPSLNPKSKQNIWTENGFTAGYILNSYGIPSSYSTGAISPYLDVADCSFIQLNNFCGFVEKTDYGYLVFYNDTKEIIRVIGSAQILNGQYYDISEITGLKYIRFTSYAYNETIEDVSVYAFTKLPEREKVEYSTKKALPQKETGIKNYVDFENLKRGAVLISNGSYRGFATGVITNKIKIPSGSSYMVINGNEQISLEKKSAYIVFKAANDTILSVKSYADGIRNGRIFKIPQPSASNPTTFIEMTMRLTNEKINECSVFFLKSADEKIVGPTGQIFGDSFDYEENQLLLPSEIFVLKNEPFSIFTSGMFREYGKEKDVAISLNYTDGNRFYTKKILEALEVNTNVTGKFLIRQQDLFNKVLYKNVTIKSVDPAEVNGTISWMAIGDSLTEGNTGNDVSPYYQAKELLASYGVVVNDFGTYHNNSKGITLEYEARGGWRYRTFVGLESKYAGLEISIPADSKSDSIPKNQNPFLYEASAKDLKEFPEWCFNFTVGDTYNVSYAENPNLASYYIFDPKAYFERRFDGSTPDIISIALGTNEWYTQQSIYNGFDLPKIKKSIDWMLNRLRASAPSTKIIVVPYHQIGFVRHLDWEDYAYPLAEYTTKIVEGMREQGDKNIHTLPLYCLDDPYSVIREISGSKNLRVQNSIQIGNSSNNVHIMDNSGNNLDVYSRALTACILNIM